MTRLQKKSIEMDKSMEEGIQRIIADNIKKKKEMGIDPDSIKATANKTMADYQSHIETAKKLIGTKNNKIAERFAYHYLFKTK